VGNRTALYDLHREAGARLVEFAGWDMPLHYGSQIEEHHAVRRASGMFDVSHMGVVDLTGADALDLLRWLLANDIARLERPGQALYTCMLNPRGGVLDDLIVYRLDEAAFRLVVNAATRGRDLDWIRAQAAGRAVAVTERLDLAMLAVQGPGARDAAHRVLDPILAARAAELGRFEATWQGSRLVARTGYTGEDGYEVMVPAVEAPALWRALLQAGVRPAGLGARDTLRLEAGLNLYGADMDESTSPLESGLGWTVAWSPADRAFVGREALEAERRGGPARALVGLLLEAAGVLRAGQKVRAEGEGAGEGVVTSGGFAPTLRRSIGLARVPAGATGSAWVEVRGRPLPARLVRPPFVRAGQPRV
jgi:aminomethyltransferase